jgi:hypothetical protein
MNPKLIVKHPAGSRLFTLYARYNGVLSEIVSTLDAGMMWRYLEGCFPRGTTAAWVILPATTGS